MKPHDDVGRTPSHTDEDPRIRQIIDEAGLPPEQADRLRGVLRPERPPERRDRRSAPAAAYKESFLRFGPGTSDDALKRRARVQAILMGVAFGALTGAAFGVFRVGGFGLEEWPALLISGGLQGLFFGAVMYWFLLAPSVRRLIALREGVGAPIDPMIDPRAGQCPTCGAEEAKVYDWKHPLNLHWTLNPALVVNELLFGQRIPKNMHRCRQCATWYVDCATCNGSIDTARWSGRDAFFRWRGLRCPDCSGDIPCQRNALAWLIELPVRPFLRRSSKRAADQTEARRA